MPAATPVIPLEPALQVQDGPWGIFLPYVISSPPVIFVTSPYSPVTPSNSSDLAADTVIPEKMVMEVAEQPLLDLFHHD